MTTCGKLIEIWSSNEWERFYLQSLKVDTAARELAETARSLGLTETALSLERISQTAWSYAAMARKEHARVPEVAYPRKGKEDE